MNLPQTCERPAAPFEAGTPSSSYDRGTTSRSERPREGEGPGAREFPFPHARNVAEGRVPRGWQTKRESVKKK